MLCKCGRYISSDFCTVCDTMDIKDSSSKEPKKDGIKQLDSKLWTIFSKYIRMRDAVKFSGGEVVKCITCNHIEHFKEFDCGHFISRRHLATKFHEKNNHAQCKGCNGLKSGQQFLYSKAIDSLYGKEYSSHLLMLSRKTMKWGAWEYNVLIKDYTERVKYLQSFIKKS